MTETVKDCHYPWTWMLVTADGEAKPCCFAPGHLGNLYESSVEGIWNGPEAIELRSYIKTDRIHPICAGAPCKFVQGTLALERKAEVQGNPQDLTSSSAPSSGVPE